MTYASEYGRQRRAVLKANGLCIDCGKRPVEAGYATCPACLARRRRAWRAKVDDPAHDAERERRRLTALASYYRKYYQRKEAGICVKCGREKAQAGYVMCRICRLYHNEMRSGYTGRF